MLERYTKPEMAELWSEQAQFQSWLDVELAACRAWSDIGVIPSEDVDTLYEQATFDIDRIHEIEVKTRHDVVAFTRAVSESLGEEKKWVHYGLTSSDVVDTAWSVRIKQANELISAKLDAFADVLQRQAVKYKHTIMMGRTHGVHAEPTTLGLKMALYFAEVQRQRTRLRAAADGISFGKISGAVGTFAHIPPEVEARTCELLGLKPEPISTQVLQRDRHAHYIATLALIGATLEKIAVEIRGLQKSEVREVEEAFRKGQKGSSAMPHKRNPVGSENITGMARLLRGYMVSAYENVALWHERDISHSSVERIIIPDATTILHYALDRMTKIVANLTVFPGNMKRNIQRTFGLYNSQRLMIALIDAGLSREDAYDTVQPLAMRAWEDEIPFRKIVDDDETISKRLSTGELDGVFDDSVHLAHVDALLERAGINPSG